jgi:hypothetical protein
VAFLNWHFGLSQLTLWRIELAPSQICRTWLPPQKPIITIPITLYGYGNGDDAEGGGSERRRDGREHGEHKRDKERCQCEARCAYLFPNISPCSYRDRRPARP